MIPEEVLELYRRHSDVIFKKRRWTFGFKPKFKVEGIDTVIQSTFGDMLLSELPVPVLIGAYDGENDKLKFFHSSDPEDGKLTVRHVLLASTAAPTYFPAHKGRWVDGGVTGNNNPCMCALAQAMSDHGWQILEHVEMLSLGTGRVIKPVRPGKWGLAQWAFKMLHVILGSSQASETYKADKILNREGHPAKLRRIQPTLETDIPLGDADALEELVGIGIQAGIMSFIHGSETPDK